jgi:formylmethanofuran dehydrogenase subunit A
VAAVHPIHWLEGLDIALLSSDAVDPLGCSDSEVAAQARTRYSSRMLRLMQANLRRANFSCLPTWTDLRHLWTIRAQSDGMDRRTAALAQAHSERMAVEVYLRHGEQRQALSGIKRFASVLQVDC